MNVKKAVIHILFFILLSLCDVALYGQVANTDYRQTPRFKKDTNRINTMLKQGFNYALNGHMDKAMALALKAQVLSQKAGYLQGICKGMNVQSYTLNRQGNFDSALVLLKRALIIGERLNDSALISSSTLYLANAYSSKGDHPTAVGYYFKGLKLEEKLRTPVNLHFYLNGIGVLFTTQKNYARGLEYLLKARDAADRTNNQKYFSTIYNNIGWRYMLVGKNDSAKYFLDLAIRYCEQSGNLYALTFPLHNLGELFVNLKQYDKAYINTIRSYEISKAQGFKDRMVANLLTLGDIDLRQNKFASTENYLKQGLVLSQQIQAKIHIKDVSLLLANLYEKQGDFDRAYYFYELFSTTKDTIMNQKNSKVITEMNIKYNTEKKEQEIELLRKNEDIQKLELAKKRNQLNTQQTLSVSIGGGFILLLIVACLLFSQYQLNKRANKELQSAYNVIEEKNTLIEKSNSTITDSLLYAKRLQDAILPPASDLQTHFKDNFFVFYQPSQIVSGDFYWHSVQQDKIIFVVADCTGHGVPGAFMSMIAHTLLNEIINERKITDTVKIAKLLDEKIIYALNQHEGSQKYDGMDISICSIDKQNQEIRFTGAHHSMYINDGKLQKIKGDPYSIGGAHHRNTKTFTSKKIKYQQGLLLYFLTDGYSDQSGGKENKRFSSKQFESMLIDFQNEPMSVQMQKLEDVFAEWKGDGKQRDDVLVAGIKC